MMADALANAADTKACEVGPGAADGAAAMFRKLFPPDAKAVLVEDPRTKSVAGDNVASRLKGSGVELVNREVDNGKGYGESMTIDLLGGGESLSRVSVRGTITEGKLMISRVNDFDGLYLEPTGNHLFVEYKDEPGIIGRIAGILGEKNINIVDIRAPQDVSSGRSLTVVKTSVQVPALLVDKIREAVNADRAFEFSYLP